MNQISLKKPQLCVLEVAGVSTASDRSRTVVVKETESVFHTTHAVSRRRIWQDLHCGTWDLVPRPGIKPGPSVLGAWSLSHWTTREVPE